MGGTCSAPALKQCLGNPQKCISLGGELLLGTINSLQVKNLKMYETWGDQLIYCSNLDKMRQNQMYKI